MADIKIAGLTKHFGDALGVEDVNLTIGDGELFVVAGPTGSGKSILVRLLAGLEEPTEGDIWIGGRSVNGLPAKDRDVALLFQNYALTPQATVFDNITITLQLQQTPSDETRQRVEAVAQMLGIQSLLERTTAGLSATHSYLVGLARAFASAPQVLLMDGPLANLPPGKRPGALEQLTEWQRQLDITVVYTTQNQGEAMQIADRLAVLRAGRIQQIGTPQQLHDRPANCSVATFVGLPQMNLLGASVVAQDEKLYLDIGVARVAVPEELAPALSAYEGKPVVLGIRPGDIFGARAAPARPTISQNSVKVQVEQVTELEDRTLLTLNTGQDTFTAVASSESVPLPGTSLDVVFDLAKIHLFDDDTRERIV